MKKEDLDRLYESIEPADTIKEKVKERASKRAWKVNLRKLIPLASACVILLTFILLSSVFYNVPVGTNALKQFQTFSEAEKYINKEVSLQRQIRNGQFSIGCGGKSTAPGGGDADFDASEPEDSGGSSGTNTQVKGIDESDIVKNNNRYIYTLKRNVYPNQIVITDTQTKQVYKHTHESIGLFQGMFLDGDSLVLFGGNKATIGFSVQVYDASNPAEIKTQKNLTYAKTRVVSARKIGKQMYFVLDSFNIMSGEKLNIPQYIEDKVQKSIEPTDLYALPAGNSVYSQIYAITIDLEKKEQTDIDVYFGNADHIYMSKNALYISSEVHGYARNAFGIFTSSRNRQTIINRFAVESGGVAYHSSLTANGYIINQFAMDEYENTFRVATTKTDGGLGGVYVYDITQSEMTLIGSVDGLGAEKNERIYSVRYEKNLCYVTTAVQTDPLYVVDLTDKTKPIVKAELKIPDVSDYMHMFDDNTIIGVGRQSTGGGGFVGIQVTLFDVSDSTNPKQLAQETFDRNTHSEIEYNHKAFLYLKNGDEALFGFPVMGEKGNYFALFETNGKELMQVGIVKFDTEKTYSDAIRGVIINGTLYSVNENEVICSELVRSNEKTEIKNPTTISFGSSSSIVLP